MAQQPAKTKDHPDVKAMQTQRDERAKVTEAAMKRMDSSVPTPTQEENDLHRLGVPVEKADDGSGPTVIRTVTVANTPHGATPPDIPEPAPTATAKTKKEW